MMKVKLGDVCEIVSGTTPKSNCPEYWNGELNWITPAELNDDIVVVNESQRKITTKAVIDSNLRSFPAGTVLLSSRAPIGKVAIAGKEMYCNQGFKNLICSDFVYNKYLFYFLKSKVTYLNSLGRGATFKEISKTIVENIQINLPKKEEQYKIVHILDKINEIIFLRQQQLKKLDELVKSRFIEMFGDPVKNEKKLPLEQLSKIGILERGKSQHRPRNAPELLGGPYPLIQTGDVSNSNIYITTYNNTYSELGLKQSKLWEPGTLCITIAANIAQTAILTFKACFPDSVVGFIPNNNTNVIFIHYWFGFFQKVLEEQAPQVAQKNINLKILSELKVILPPIELQNQFAAFVKQTDKSKLEIQKSLDKLEILKKSLMQQYFG